MSASLGSLFVSLGLDAAEYTRGLDKAQRDAQRKSEEIQRVLTQAGTLIAAGAATATVGLIALTKSSIDAADNLLALSKTANVSVETLGGIGFAASQAGSDLEGVAGSLGKLNLKIAEAARGEKEASNAFEKLGISVTDAAGNVRQADKVLLDLADRFSSYEDGPEKAALANAVFGKSYGSILPLLNDGGKALQDNIEYYQRLSGVTTETALQADQFNDTLGKINLASGQLGRTLAAELLPTLQLVADEVLKTAENSEFFATAAAGVKTVLDTLVIVAANVAFVFAGVGREIGGIAAQLAALARLDIKGFNAISAAMKEDAARARAELESFERRVLLSGTLTGKRLDASTDPRSLTFGQPLPTVGGTRAPGLGGDTGGGGRGRAPAAEATSEAQRYLDTLSRQVERTQELSAVETALLEIRRGLKGLNAQVAGEILDKAAQIDASKRLQSQLQAEAEQVRAWQAEQRQLQEEGRRVFEATRTPAEQLAAELDRLNRLLQQGAIDWDTYARAQFAAQDQFDASNKKAVGDAEKVGSLANDLGLSFSSAFEDAIVNGGKLSDVMRGLEQDILRIITRKLITEPLGNAITGFLGGGGGASGGGFLSSLFSGFFATGGYIPPGRWGMTGERGPEPVFGGRTGVTVQPNSSMGMQVSQQFVISRPVDKRTQAQVFAAAARGAREGSLRGTA